MACMPVWISMLRGVNVGSHNRIKMEALRTLYESVKLEDPRTYVQSGNVIFRAKDKKGDLLAKKIQSALERKFKFTPAVVVRTAEEMRETIDANPFAGRNDVEPGKLLVTFLSAEPAKEAHSALAAFNDFPEELHLRGPRALHLLPQRRRQIQIAVVEGREIPEGSRHRPKLEQRQRDAGTPARAENR